LCFLHVVVSVAVQELEPVPTARPGDSVNQHLLAQLLLVFQWTAALCRVWPSSIPHAAPLHNLLSDTLAAAAKLILDPTHAVGHPHPHRNLGCVSTPCGMSSAELSVPVAAAVLEVAAIVLEPLGLLLHEHQEAQRKGKPPPSISVLAHILGYKLQGEPTALLQAMLAVCLDQLTVHAERKLRASDVSIQQQALKQGAGSSATASCHPAGSSSMKKYSGERV
jgi:hypothetical protein